MGRTPCKAYASFFGLFDSQQIEHPVRRRHAVHGCVEKRPEGAHGQEELGRKEYDGERGGKTQITMEELAQRQAYAHRRAAVCQHVHDRDGVQLQAKHAHRCAAKALGLLVHQLMAGFVRLIDLERGKALDILEEASAQIEIAPPVVSHDPLRHFLKHHYGSRDKRHAHKQHERGGKRERREESKQRKRRKKRVEELRKVRAEIHLELFDPFDAYLHGLAARDVLRVRGPHFNELVVHLAADELFRPAGNLGAHTLCGDGGRDANDDARDAQEKKGLTGQPKPGQNIGGGRGDNVGFRQSLLDKQSKGCENHDIGHEGKPFQADDSGNHAPRFIHERK